MYNFLHQSENVILDENADKMEAMGLNTEGRLVLTNERLIFVNSLTGIVEYISVNDIFLYNKDFNTSFLSNNVLTVMTKQGITYDFFVEKKEGWINALRQIGVYTVKNLNNVQEDTDYINSVQVNTVLENNMSDFNKNVATETSDLNSKRQQNKFNWINYLIVSVSVMIIMVGICLIVSIIEKIQSNQTDESYKVGNEKYSFVRFDENAINGAVFLTTIDDVLNEINNTQIFKKNITKVDMQKSTVDGGAVTVYVYAKDNYSGMALYEDNNTGYLVGGGWVFNISYYNSDDDIMKMMVCASLVMEAVTKKQIDYIAWIKEVFDDPIESPSGKIYPVDYDHGVTLEIEDSDDNDAYVRICTLANSKEKFDERYAEMYEDVTTGKEDTSRDEPTTGKEDATTEPETDAVIKPEAEDSEIQTLINAYFDAAYIKADMNQVAKYVDDITNINLERYKSRQKYIESFHNVKTYKFDSTIENTFIVFVSYDAKIKNIETLAPSAETFIVVYDDADKKMYIHNPTVAEELDGYIAEGSNLSAISELGQDVRNRLDEALATDEELKKVFDILTGAGQ